MRGTKPTPSLIRIIPALVHIQAHLDQDLSLDLLADEVRLSKYHFHQLFRRVTGETPKSYVDRLRLERAAVQLRIRRAAVLEIALECGYRNHETFSRAFRARFAMSPRDYRQQWSRRENDKRSARFQRATSEAQYAKLSTTRIVRLARMIVAFIRHLGPYERVAADDFKRLTAWTAGAESVANLRCSWASRTMRRASRRPRRFGSTAVFKFQKRSMPTAISPASGLRAASTPSPITWARGTCNQPTLQFSNVFGPTPRWKSSGCRRSKSTRRLGLASATDLAQVSIAIPVKSRRTIN